MERSEASADRTVGGLGPARLQTGSQLLLRPCLALERHVQLVIDELSEIRLVAGMLVDGNGNRMTLSHAVTKGTRYGYYVPRCFSDKGLGHGTCLRPCSCPIFRCRSEAGAG